MTEEQRREKLIGSLVRMFRRNVGLIADARDSNEPWNLLDRLDRFNDNCKEENRIK